MMIRGFWILCYITSFAASCKTVERLRLKKQQIGFRMCQHFCQQMSGCHALTYTHRNLTCQISDKFDPAWASENRINIFNVSETDSSNVTGNRKCHLGNIYIRSRARLLQCVQYRRRQEDQAKKDSACNWTEYLKMTSDTYEICQKLYILCDSGKERDAKTPLSKLCAKSGRAGRRSCASLNYCVFKRGCDLSKLSPVKDTILHRAAGAGLLHVVKCVLSKSKINLERRNSHGMTPIMKAAYNARTEMFKFLLNVGSVLLKTDKGGNSLLHLVCLSGNLTIVKDILMMNSEGMQRRTKQGLTPIMTTVSLGNEAIFKFLLEKGSNLSEVTDCGRNILHIASSQHSSKLVKYLLESKIADIDSEDNMGRTPLLIAALHGQRRVFHFLLDNNASLSVVDANGNNLLHMACKGGDMEIAKTLLKRMKKDALTKINKEGKTPLEVINKGRHGDLLRILTQMQKDANDEDNAALSA